MPRQPQSKPAEWRDFELLVSRIEQVLVGNAIFVKSPDRIPSLITRRKREVDASIRTKVGSASILVTVECRKRGAVQDVTWIEQLACKRQAIGAARTIAVASSSFSSEAIRAAAHYGIDLRVLSQITDAEFHQWLLPASVVHVFKHCDLLEQPVFIYYPEPTDSSAGSQILSAGDKPVDVTTKVFIGSDGTELSLDDLWKLADDQLKIFDGVPVDNKVHTRRLSLEPDDELLLRTPIGNRRVREIKLALGLRWRHEEVRLADAKVNLYSHGDPSNRSPSHVRAEFETKETTVTNIRFGYQQEQGSSLASISVELLPTKR